MPQMKEQRGSCAHRNERRRDPRDAHHLYLQKTSNNKRCRHEPKDKYAPNASPPKTLGCSHLLPGQPLSTLTAIKSSTLLFYDINKMALSEN